MAEGGLTAAALMRTVHGFYAEELELEQLLAVLKAVKPTSR